MISRSRAGILVHARLGVASENSGKLVSLVRREAARIAREQGSRHLIVDGSPGIGCPVIASITGAERVLIVTEPSVSAEHDLNRVLSLAGHFEIPAYVCVNKWDLNPHISARIEKTAADSAARFAGRIRFDPEVTRAQIAERTVLETGAPSAEDIRELWQRISREE
jgi:MinD superfamily P-loop ATPase